MSRVLENALRNLTLVLVSCLGIVGFTPRAESAERTNVNIVVKDAGTDQPIYQARLTLQFREPASKIKLQRSKPSAYSAKTNAQGRYRFTNIPKGTIHLIVTSEQHQSFGKDFELEQDNQVIEVKLRKPQPLL